MHGGHPRDYQRDNITGTRTVLAAARSAGVGRFVLIGAAGCLVGGRPIIDADESWNLHEPRYSPYLATKTIADRDVRAANTAGFVTCVIRPGWVWGEGDPLLDAITAAARAGTMMLIDHGKHPIVTSHRDNAVQAILLALTHAAGGEAYYIFDDGAVTTREFLTALLDAKGLPAPTRSIPYPLARSVALAIEAARSLTRRPGEAPISRLMVEFNGRPFVVSDAKARSELGYRPAITRDEGLSRIRKRSNFTPNPTTQ
jgi:nucleoside-diphosphate-sugar epimerase